MDQARYFLAVLMILAVPPAIVVWYFIHPFVAFWRRLGTVATYCIVFSLSGCAYLLLWEARRPLLGADLGFQPLLLALALPAAALGLFVAARRRKLLSQWILIGIPEVSITDKGRLLTGGIYAQTRNPRYLEFLLLIFAYAAFANYSGLWILYALTLPAIHLVVLLEERELRDRFGAEYEEYCRGVPRYIPRRRSAA
jgi:hypothetical protein